MSNLSWFRCCFGLGNRPNSRRAVGDRTPSEASIYSATYETPDGVRRFMFDDEENVIGINNSGREHWVLVL